MTEPSTQERIAIVDLADDLQVRKQRIFKILERLNIRPSQRREQSRGNQPPTTLDGSRSDSLWTSKAASRSTAVRHHSQRT